MPSSLPDPQRDARFMARALFVAERGRGRTHPNPIVGAVVVTPDGIVVGQGAHLKAGEAHAEVHALDAVGDLARGATLYCTLEPCCHHGRTGPCVERIAAAGIARVVTAVEDPNPRVAGEGHAWLRARGIAVTTGVGESEARAQNAPFLISMAQARPWTLVKTAVSASGTVGGPGARLTHACTNRWMHRQRAWVDAILVGAGTVLADDPILTARGAWRERPLTRVVVDWRARVPVSARVYQSAAAGPVIMVCLESAFDTAQDPLASHGVRVERFATRDLSEVSRRLGQIGIQSLLVEGGPTLQDAWLASAPVDAVQWVQTRTAAGGPPAATRLRAWRDRTTALPVRLGDDELFEGVWS